MAGQVINYEAIEAKLNTIKQDIESADRNLQGIDILVNGEFGPSGSSWSGQNSATDFLNQWHEYAEQIPTFLETMKKQEASVHTLLQKEKAVDQAKVVVN